MAIEFTTRYVVTVTAPKAKEVRTRGFEDFVGVKNWIEDAIYYADAETVVITVNNK